jgi:anti-sigma factor RsiW
MRGLLAKPGIKFQAPTDIRAQVFSAIAGTTGPEVEPARLGAKLLRLLGQWSLVPSLAALAASLFLFFNAPSSDLALQNEIVASHVRSLLADHLADVKTSNQHTVKPWFNGKIDFAPPVVDLAAQGFPLIGGRVDYVGGKVVAALVYRHGGHVINLFVWPQSGARPETGKREGYSVRAWSAGDLVFWAISDINIEDLNAFQKAFAAAALAETESTTQPK